MTIDELCDYIEKNADKIYVREKIGGKWDSFSLTELPSSMAIHHALRFVKEHRMPVFLKD